MVTSINEKAGQLDGALARIRVLQDEMNASNVERENAVRTLLLAASAGEHVFLEGPPGTGKSRIAEQLCNAIEGEFFDILFTRYTTPDEVFGPFSMNKMQQDVLERIIPGYAPTADVWFLDEIFKASSAILNTLLKALNERRMRQGTGYIDLPLWTVVAASNEIPSGDDNLGALYDRFLERLEILPVEDRANWELVISGKLPPVTAKTNLTDLKRVRERGVELVQLQVYAKNGDGLAFWRSQGFESFLDRMWLDL